MSMILVPAGIFFVVIVTLISWAGRDSIEYRPPVPMVIVRPPGR